jgi:hypothetical protein
MFRIVTRLPGSGSRGLGAFNHNSAFHSCPRRYKTLQAAVAKAKLRAGEHEVVDDERSVCAYIKDTVVRAISQKYQHLNIK